MVETEFWPPNSTNSHVDTFRDETDTKIDLPDSGSDSDMITITGKKPNVNKAVAEIQKIQNEMANITSQEVKIPAKIHNTMIGAGGKLIQSIMNECGGVSCGCGCFSCLFLFGIFWTSLNVFLLDGLCRKFICCWQYSFFLAIYMFSQFQIDRKVLKYARYEFIWTKGPEWGKSPAFKLCAFEAETRNFN